jgi:hypothetical protein
LPSLKRDVVLADLKSYSEKKKVDEIFLSDAKSKNCPLYKDEDKISLFWHCTVQTK